mgnify:CR=1 FL=1
MPKRELLGTTRAEFAASFADWGFSRVHVAKLWSRVHRAGEQQVSAILELPPGLREKIEAECQATTLSLVRETNSSDGLTRKFLLALEDGQQIETVLMRYRGRMTACVSSQAGCALGCVFCATGQMGFSRNLTAGDIVAQVHFAQRALRESDPSP